MKTEFPSMRELVIKVGGPLLPNENRKAWLARVARIAGISPRVATAAFYEETTSRIAAAKLKAAAGHNASDNIASEFERMASSLEVQDPDFYGQHASAMRDIARAFRGLGRALGRPDDRGGERSE